MKRFPKKCLWWGIICVVVGGLLMAFAPAFMSVLVLRYDPNFDVLTGITEAIGRIVSGGLFPFGAALIAAALVMKYLDDSKLQETSSEFNGSDEADY